MKSINEFYKYWVRLANTSGANAKKAILNDMCIDFPFIKKVLFYAYNPYYKFHIRKLDVSPKGTGFLSNESFSILDKLRLRKITGHDSLNMTYAHMGSLSVDAFNIFKGILHKDLRLGINVKTINAVLGKGFIPEFAVTLAKNFEPHRIKYPCFSTVKKDGVRGLFLDKDFISRSGRPLIGLDSLIREILEHANYKNYDLDGELMVAGIQDFDIGAGKIRDQNDTPDAEFHIFEVLNSELPFKDRLKILESLQSKHIKPVETIIVNSHEEAYAHYEKVKAEGDEGTVLKPIQMAHQSKRTWDWARIKGVETFDLPVVGYFEGTGKNKGTLGGLIVEYKGKEVRVGSGYKDDGYHIVEHTRNWIWDNIKELIGNLIEVKCQNVTGKGALRYPTFLRWRNDK